MNIDKLLKELIKHERISMLLDSIDYKYLSYQEIQGVCKKIINLTSGET